MNAVRDIRMISKLSFPIVDVFSSRRMVKENRPSYRRLMRKWRSLTCSTPKRVRIHIGIRERGHGRKGPPMRARAWRDDAHVLEVPHALDLAHNEHAVALAETR